MGENWKDSLYSGALLSQIGEFSFVLGAIGLQTGIIAEFAYQVIINVISITLLLTPIWIMAITRLTGHNIKNQ